MKKHFKIMIPYRINKTNDEYTEIIESLVKYIRSTGIKVVNLLETDILDENNAVVEHVYMLACYGKPNKVSNIFSNSMKGHYGELVLYS